MHRYSLTFLWLTIFAFAATAQTADSLNNKKSPATSFAPVIKYKAYYPDSTHKPHKAAMRSLFLPGLGQLYNRRWWKVPIVYGGLGLLGSAVVFNQKQYKLYSALAILKRDGDPASPKSQNHALYQKYKVDYKNYSGLSLAGATSGANYYQRYRDLSILGVAALWTINVLDAYIDAKFINSFSVDNNLTVKPVTDVLTRPVYAGNYAGSLNPGLKIIFVIR